MIACARCGQANPPNYQFCHACGTAATKASAPQAAQAASRPRGRKCKTCQLDVPPGFRFCGSCGTKVDDAPAPAPAPAAASMRVSLTLIRPDGSRGALHPLVQGPNRIGRNHGAAFANDGYLSPDHAEIMVSPAAITVRDVGSLNGVFFRMGEGDYEIGSGQIVRIGQELLRFDRIRTRRLLPDGTQIFGSPDPGYWGTLTMIIGPGLDGPSFPLLGDEVTLGRERGEINFPDDGYVSGLHARLANRNGVAFLADLGSSNGTFLKVSAAQPLAHGACVLLGQQLFQLTVDA